MANSCHQGSEVAGHCTPPQSAPLSSQALRSETAQSLSATLSGRLTRPTYHGAKHEFAEELLYDSFSSVITLKHEATGVSIVRF